MKDIKKWAFSFVMFVVAMLLSKASASHYNFEKLILFVIFIIATGGFTISVIVAVWSKQNQKSSFVNSLKISFGLSALLFICGYLFNAINPIIFK